jgi:hypothetical protein
MKSLSRLSLLALLLPAAALANPPADLSLELYAGQHELIGEVLVCDDGYDLMVTYDATGGAVLSTTHLYADLDAPRKHSPGRFDYKHEDISTQVDEFSISLSDLDASAGDTLYLAAHADTNLIVGYEEPVLELAPEIPDTVTISSTRPGGSYWVTTVTDGGDLNGTYPGWCVDTDRNMSPGATYTAEVYSSYEAAAAGYVEQPEDLDQVNWIINQDYVGQASSGCSGNYTLGDVQRAIWTLIEDPAGVGTAGLGAWSQCRADEILAAAAAAGEGFMPGCEETMAVMLVPINANGGQAGQVIIAQVTVIEVDLECAPILGGEETAWAAGEHDFRRSWASYFEYEVGSTTCE